eukprot:11025617-Lingulodinium_polyedra.AAC.1
MQANETKAQKAREQQQVFAAFAWFARISFAKALSADGVDGRAHDVREYLEAAVAAQAGVGALLSQREDLPI